MPAAVRYLTLHRLAFSITALTVLVTAISASAAAAFAASVVTIANRETLADNQTSRILVTANTSDFTSANAQVTTAIARASADLPMSFTSAQISNALNLPAGIGGRKAQTELVDLQQVRQHAVLVSGAWPAASAGAGPAGVVQACLPATAAALLHLRPGSQLAVHDSTTNAAAIVGVACIFRERAPSLAYWQLNQIGLGGVSRQGGFSLYGPMVTTEPASSWPVPMASAAWLAQPDFGHMTAPNLASLGSSISNALNGLTNSQTLAAVVTTNLPTLLENQAVALEVARSLLLIGELILLVMAGATLAVAVNLLAAQRAGQPELLQARGANRRQLAACGATDAALLSIPAAVAGPPIGALVAPIVARLGVAGSADLRLPTSLPLVAWLAGIAVAAGCAVVIALPWMRQPPSPIAYRTMTARRRAVASALTSGADIALILLAAGAAWQLARYASSVSSGLTGTIGIDPILVAAPVLALSAGTLVMLRVLPLVVRLGERAASRGRGITVPAAAWMISRRALRQAGPVLLTVLAVATTVIALGETTSWLRSVHDQADFAVGADERVTLAAAGALPPGQVGKITSARGVSAVTPAIQIPFVLQATNTPTSLLALDSPLAEHIVPIRSDLAIKPARDPLAPISSNAPDGVRMPGRPTALRLVVSLTGSGSGTQVNTGNTTSPTTPYGIVGASLTGITDATLALQVTDASGAAYQVGSAALAPDGKSRAIEITIPGGKDADYPLTLSGFSLSYALPVTQPGQVASLDIHSVSVVGGSAGSPPVELPSVVSAGQQQTALVSAPPVVPAAPGLTTGLPHLVSYRRAGTGVVVSFAIGAGSESSAYGFATDYGSVTVTPRAPKVLAGLATKAFLAASGLSVGDTVEVNGLQAVIPVQIDGEMAQFPTITGSGGAVIVNQATLQLFEQEYAGGPLPVTNWWIRTSGRSAFTSLPAGSTVTTLASVTASLRRQPLGVAPLAALIAVAAIALLLAAAGFLVSISSARERGRDIAVLDALGASRGQITRLRCLEQAMLSVPAAAGGLALGLLLSRLIIPAVTITAQATQPVPSVLVLIPIMPAVGIALAIAALPVVAVALVMTRGTATMARLGEDTSDLEQAVHRSSDTRRAGHGPHGADDSTGPSPRRVPARSARRTQRPPESAERGASGGRPPESAERKAAGRGGDLRLRGLRAAVIGEAGAALALALAGIAALTTFVAAAGPRVIAAEQTTAVRQAAAAFPPSEDAIEAAGDWQPVAGRKATIATLRQQAVFGQTLAKLLRPRLSPDDAGIRTWVTGPLFQLTKAARSAIYGRLPWMQLSYDSGLTADSRLLSGHWPGRLSRGLPGPSAADRNALVIQVVVTPAVASRFGLHTGSVMQLGTQGGSRLVGLLVTGIVNPGPGYFWASTQVLATPSILNPNSPFASWQGGAVISQAELTGLQQTLWSAKSVQGVWYVPLRLGPLTTQRLPPLGEAVTAVTIGPDANDARLASGLPFTLAPQITSQLPTALGELESQLAAGNSLDEFVIFGIFAAALLLILMCAGLAAQRYEAEFSLLRARGGSVGQVARRGFYRALGAAGPGVAIGLAVAIVVSGTGSFIAIAWVLPAITGVLALASVPVRSAWRARRRTTPQEVRQAEMARPRRSGRRLVAELTIVLAGLGAVVALEVRGLANGTDALALASPLLVAAAASIAIARLYPLPVRALLPLATHRRGPVGFFGLARAGRAAPSAILPALALVLTMTMTAFGWMMDRSATAGQVTTSWQQSGADATVTTIRNNVISTGDQAAFAKVPGVRHTALVYTTAATTEFAPTLFPTSDQGPGAGQGFNTGLLVVNPGQYAAVAAGTPWPQFPASALSRRSGRVPILISTAAAPQDRGRAFTGADQVLQLDGIDMPVVIAGTISATPAFPVGGSYVVMPQWAVGQFPSISGMATLLAIGPSLSAARLTAVARRHVPGGLVVIRSQVLHALRTSVIEYAIRLFTISIWASAGLSVVALMFGLAATASSRKRLRSRMTAMGMSSRQAGALALTDTIPLLVVAILGMAASGAALVLISRNVVNLAPLTGSGGVVGVTLTLPALLVPAAAVIVLALGAVALEHWRAARAESATALRTEEAW